MFERSHQAGLFGFEDVEFDTRYSALKRIRLDDSGWIDYQPMWLSGDETLFDCLAQSAEWSQPLVKMFDREVLTPRLVARVEADTHTVIAEIVDSLSDKYGKRLDQISAGWYRDGRDSVAYHGDRIARERLNAIVATVSLGSPRRFVIRPKAGGESKSFSLGHGDLVVMGGSCQRLWEHSVPKVKSAAPRIALMFRHSYS